MFNYLVDSSTGEILLCTQSEVFQAEGTTPLQAEQYYEPGLWTYDFEEETFLEKSDARLAQEQSAKLEACQAVMDEKATKLEALKTALDEAPEEVSVPLLALLEVLGVSLD